MNDVQTFCDTELFSLNTQSTTAEEKWKTSNMLKSYANMTQITKKTNTLSVT